MNELRPHGRELLEAARRERTPSAAEHARLLQELLQAAQSSSPSIRPKRALGAAAKLVLLAALATAIAVVLYFASHAGR
jgi:hypothetical protein